MSKIGQSERSSCTEGASVSRACSRSSGGIAPNRSGAMGAASAA